MRIACLTCWRRWVAPKRVEFSEAYDDHVWDVYGFLGYRLNSREETEDLTQVTFERAFKAWERFDPERASVKTWLLAIARNAVIDHYRGNRASNSGRCPRRAMRSCRRPRSSSRTSAGSAPTRTSHGP